MRFSKQQVTILKHVAIEVDEVFSEVRKGIPQTKYIFEVRPGATWDDWEKDQMSLSVPDELVGLWMMSYSGDLTSEPLREALADYDWVKCLKRETTAWEYVAL